MSQKRHKQLRKEFNSQMGGIPKADKLFKKEYKEFKNKNI